LIAEEILDIGPTETKQRAKFNGSNPRAATCSMVAHPTLGDTQAIGHLLRAKEMFGVSKRYKVGVFTIFAVVVWLGKLLCMGGTHASPHETQ